MIAGTFRRRHRATARLGAMATALALTAGTIALAAGATATARTTSLADQVTITRDAAGIPHITARSFTALGYGTGYAFAQDNLCTFANDIVTVEGNRSKYFGPKATAVNYSAGVASSNLDSDLFWRLMGAQPFIHSELTSKGANGLLPQVRQMYTGWAEGYNAYLKSGKLRDPACKGKPWVHPITVRDLILRGTQIVTEASSQQFISALAATTPPLSAAAVRHTSAATTGTAKATVAARFSAADRAALRREFHVAAKSIGSNGIGLGSQDTRSGHGMVLANPHFPWRGTERFWMAQEDVPGSYDVEGGTLEGFPFVGIGFNRNIAWTHTVSTDQRFLLYQLNLSPSSPTTYVVNGRSIKMGHITVSVHYGHSTVRHTFYTTRWGVIVSVPAAFYVWSGSNAYALDDFTGDAGARAANEYFEMGRATSVHGLYNVEAKYLAIPTFNTIAADDKGWAYYGDVGATPAVSAAEVKRCMPTGLASYVYQEAGIITLDGSQASCAPADIKGTPERGIFSGTQLPHLFRLDYVENSNNSYWLANPSHPLTGYSPIIGLTDQQQDGRTRLGNAMIAARVAGTDGLGAPKFTISTLQKMWEGDRSDLAESVLPQLVSACEATPSAIATNGQVVDLAAACAALASYNGTGKLGATGGWLFYVWSDLDTDTNFYATPFNAAEPLTTPTGLNTTTAHPLVWLADAVQNLEAHHIALNASFGQVQHAPQSTRIPIPGCSGESSGQGMGCFNAIYAPDGTPATAGAVNGGPYGQVNEGSSLVMTTQLNPGGPTSEGILTYSQASDPTSRWYSNMTRLYSKGRWVKLPYTARELAADDPGRALTLFAP